MHQVVVAIVPVVLVALLGACKSEPSSRVVNTPGEGAAGGSANPDAPAAVASNQPAPAAVSSPPPAVSKFYAIEELVALGLQASPLAGGETLLCEPGGRCICLKPLDCGAAGCISYDDNLAHFRATLKNPGPGRTLSCKRAEVGQCDLFRYFNFEGDLYRRELRWFDETGTLVAQRNMTDYDAYCQDQTRSIYLGKLPKCEKLTDREHICGEDRHMATTAIDDLRRFTARPPGPQ